MKQRCTNPNDRCFRLYGGRGITICDRWLHSFEAFLEDMGERPESMTIDRIDVNGNYESGNVKWSSLKQQVNNRRRPPPEDAAMRQELRRLRNRERARLYRAKQKEARA